MTTLAGGTFSSPGVATSAFQGHLAATSKVRDSSDHTESTLKTGSGGGLLEPWEGLRLEET